MRTKSRVARFCRALLAAVAVVAAALLWAAAGTLAVKGVILYRDALRAKPLAACVAEQRARPDYVPLSALPACYTQAVVAVEDSRFYRHGGVDVLSIARAAWVDLTSLSLKEGGSTITQQLVKNLYFTQEKRLARKIAEALMALTLESAYSKEEILELYVNTIYFGSGYTGVDAASKGYFGVPPGEMNACQCTLLAGIPQAPTAYAPNAHPELPRERQKTVVARMVEAGCLTDEQGRQILDGTPCAILEGGR